jgi:hypothetical protein
VNNSIFKKRFKNNIKIKLKAKIIPPMSAVLDLCFFKILSGLSKILIIFDNFLNLNIMSIFRDIVNKKNIIISKYIS